MTWNTPRGAGLQYCAKVGIAAFFGYLLCVGERQQYGIYGAFTAALIVGTSVGEDLATSGNRVLGTLAGMAAGLAVAAAFGMSAVTLAAGVALTAFIATGFGWGVPAARIGASVCAVIVAAHVTDAFEYSLMRATNTLIGVGVGLLVSLVVLPVRGRHEIARGRAATVAAAAALLESGRTDAEGLSALRLTLLSAALALEKAARDMARERLLNEDVAGLLRQAREAQTVGLCAMAGSLALSKLETGGLSPAALAELHEMAGRVAALLRGDLRGARIDTSPLRFEELAARLNQGLPDASLLRLTLPGCLHELHEIELTLTRARAVDQAGAAGSGGSA